MKLTHPAWTHFWAAIDEGIDKYLNDELPDYAPGRVKLELQAMRCYRENQDLLEACPDDNEIGAVGLTYLFVRMDVFRALVPLFFLGRQSQELHQFIRSTALRQGPIDFGEGCDSP